MGKLTKLMGLQITIRGIARALSMRHSLDAEATIIMGVNSKAAGLEAQLTATLVVSVRFDTPPSHQHAVVGHHRRRSFLFVAVCVTRLSMCSFPRIVS